MNKKRIFLISSLILITGILVVTAATISHSSSKVLVTFGNYKMSLQEASNEGTGGYLVQGVAPPASSGEITSLSDGHDASEIWVSVDGTESTLQTALDGSGLCGSTAITGYDDYNLNPGHLATEIPYGTSNLQAAIDAGDFCACDLSCAPYTCESQNTKVVMESNGGIKFTWEEAEGTITDYYATLYQNGALYDFKWTDGALEWSPGISLPTGDYEIGVRPLTLKGLGPLKSIPFKIGGCEGACSETCSNLGYECGTHTVCLESFDCGTTCGDSNKKCDENGKCVPKVYTLTFPNGHQMKTRSLGVAIAFWAKGSPASISVNGAVTDYQTGGVTTIATLNLGANANTIYLISNKGDTDECGCASSHDGVAGKIYAYDPDLPIADENLFSYRFVTSGNQILSHGAGNCPDGYVYTPACGGDSCCATQFQTTITVTYD